MARDRWQVGLGAVVVALAALAAVAACSGGGDGGGADTAAADTLADVPDAGAGTDGLGVDGPAPPPDGAAGLDGPLPDVPGLDAPAPDVPGPADVPPDAGAGADGSGDTPSDDAGSTPGPPVRPEVATFAAKASVCTGDGLMTFLIWQPIVDGALLDYGPADAYEEMIGCAAAAADCPAVLACLGYVDGAGCDPEEFEPRCRDAQTTENCVALPGGASAWAPRPCGVTRPLDASCIAGRCGAGTCVDPGSRCDGDVVVTCVEGLERRVACGARAACAQPAGQPATCDFGADCGENEARCEGDVLLTCRDYDEADSNAVDCPRLFGTRCLELGEGWFECAAEAGDCVDAGGCDGAEARVCLLDRNVRLDCGAFPGAVCTEGDFGPACALP